MSVDHHQSIQFVLNRLFCWINGQSAAGGQYCVNLMNYLLFL